MYQGEWRDDKPGGLRAAEAGGAVRDASKPLYVEGLGLVRNASALYARLCWTSLNTHYSI